MLALLILAFLAGSTQEFTSDSVSVISALLSAIAVFAALVTLERDRKHRIEDHRLDQASKVSFWIESHLEDNGTSPARDELFAWNGSDSPVYRFTFPVQPSDQRSVQMIQKQLIKPGLNLVSADKSILLASLSVFYVEFMDSKGVCWRRDSNGNLSETTISPGAGLHPDDLAS